MGSQRERGVFCRALACAALCVAAVAGSALTPTRHSAATLSRTIDGHTNFATRWAVVLAHDDINGSKAVFSTNFLSHSCAILGLMGIPWHNRILLIRDNADLPGFDGLRSCYGHWVPSARVVTLMDVLLGSPTSEGQPLAASVPATATDILLILGAHGYLPAKNAKEEDLYVMEHVATEGGMELQRPVDDDGKPPTPPALGDGAFPASGPHGTNVFTGQMLVWLTAQLQKRSPAPPLLFGFIVSCYSSSLFNLLVQRVDKGLGQTKSRVKDATFHSELQLPGTLFLTSASDTQPTVVLQFMLSLVLSISNAECKTWQNLVDLIRKKSASQQLWRSGSTSQMSPEQQRPFKEAKTQRQKMEGTDKLVVSTTVHRAFRMRAFGDKTMLQHTLKPEFTNIPVQIIQGATSPFPSELRTPFPAREIRPIDTSIAPIQQWSAATDSPPRGTLPTGADLRQFIHDIELPLRKYLVYPGEVWAELCFKCAGKRAVRCGVEVPSDCKKWTPVVHIRRHKE